MRIAVVGDYQPDHETHPATTDALQHSAGLVGVEVEVDWVPTESVPIGAGAVSGYDGVFIAPASPYRSMEGALSAISAARTRGVPLLGTCAGFQHIVLEFARNVLETRDAQSAEYGVDEGPLFVTPLSCSLAGQTFEVYLTEESVAARAYGATSATERYYCNFGLNPDRRGDLEGAGLLVSGTDDSGEARVIELAGHPFFVGTLFVPQVASREPKPHPLVTAFVSAAAAVLPDAAPVVDWAS
jgi:CTP synthase (UTP-ammonia lyase)